MWTEQNGNEISLYGRIWGGDGQFISSDLKAFLKKNPKAVVRLHTPGGSVIDGNLIYNTLINSKADIHIIVDGLAASMGSILILAGKKVSIAENAYIMVHAPSGSVEGNARTMTGAAKMLASIEANFIKKYATKTGKPEAELKDWMTGDNWFSAEEALEAGLVDEIIDPVIENLNVSAAYGEYNLVALSEDFKEFDKKFENSQSDKNKPPKQEKKMKLNAVNLKSLGLSEDATEEQINAAIAKKDEQIEKMRNDAKAKTDAEIEAILAGAITAGKILPADKDTYKGILEANLDSGKKVIADLQARKGLAGEAHKESNAQSDGKESWTFADWRKKDTAGLLALKTSDPDRYKSIVEQK